MKSWFKRFASRPKASSYIEVFDDQFTSDLVNQVNKYLVANADLFQVCNRPSDYCVAVQIDKELDNELDAEIYKIIYQCAKRYQELHPSFQLTKDTGYEILIHKEHDYMHRQYFPTSLIVMFCLTDCHGEEGAIVIPEQNRVLHSKVGRVIMIPGSFIYSFYMKPVINGERVSIFTSLK